MRPIILAYDFLSLSVPISAVKPYSTLDRSRAENPSALPLGSNLMTRLGPPRAVRLSVLEVLWRWKIGMLNQTYSEFSTKKMVKWDLWLAYDTVKIVRIENWKLGLLHYSLMAAIVAYTVGYDVLYQKRYVRVENPIGSVRLSLRPPCATPAYACGSIQPPANWTTSCRRSPPSELQYCLQYNQTYPNSTWPNNQCRYYDDSLALYPSMEQSAMFVSSRVREDLKTLECDITDPTCQFTTIPRPRNQSVFYIAEIERFTIQLDHSMYATDFGVQRNAASLKGSLKGCNGSAMSVEYPDIVGQAQCKDTFQLSTLLKAACVDSLDTEAAVTGAKDPESKRSAGVVLIVFIQYTNLGSYDLTDYEYTYTVDYVENTEFKTEQSIYDRNLTSVTVWSRHGVRIIVLQTGNIGRFDFQTLLLTFVGGFGLMAAATVIVDFLATKILPRKNFYAHLKYQEVIVGPDTPALSRDSARTPMLSDTQSDQPTYNSLS